MAQRTGGILNFVTWKCRGAKKTLITTTGYRVRACELQRYRGRDPGHGCGGPLCFWLISCGDEFVDDPLGGANRVGVGQPKDEVLEAGVDGATDGVPRDVGLVVGDR